MPSPSSCSRMLHVRCHIYVYGERHSSSTSERCFRRLSSKLSRFQSFRSLTIPSEKFFVLPLEVSPNRCPSLLPEHELHCSGDKMPPAIPIKHSGQRKVVEQWFSFFLLLLHITAISELLSAGCLPTLLLDQGLCLEPKWQRPFWYSTASPTLFMYPPYWWDSWGIVGMRTLQISTESCP